jgi:hypothetical protein
MCKDEFQNPKMPKYNRKILFRKNVYDVASVGAGSVCGCAVGWVCSEVAVFVAREANDDTVKATIA